MMHYGTVPRFLTETRSSLIIKSLIGLSFIKGDEEKMFRNKLCAVSQMTKSILMPSARAALYWILKAVKPPRIYIPAYLCYSIDECIKRANIPVTYLDLEPGSFETRFDGVKYEESSILLLVHQYGIPSDPEKALEISNKYGLILIEDNAAALGATWRGIPTGSFGHASIVSFEYSKIISACKGGASLFREKKFADYIDNYIKEKSQEKTFQKNYYWLRDALEGIFYDVALTPILYSLLFLPLFRLIYGPYMNRSQGVSSAGSYRSEFGSQRAALASRMINRLHEIVTSRNRVAMMYEGILSSLKHIKIVPSSSSVRPAYTHYPILVPRGTRLRIARELWSRGVDPGFNFSYLCGGDGVSAVAPVAMDVTHRILTLPISSRINEKLAEKIAIAFYDAVLTVT